MPLSTGSKLLIDAKQSGTKTVDKTQSIISSNKSKLSLKVHQSQNDKACISNDFSSKVHIGFGEEHKNIKRCKNSSKATTTWLDSV